MSIKREPTGMGKCDIYLFFLLDIIIAGQDSPGVALSASASFLVSVLVLPVMAQCHLELGCFPSLEVQHSGLNEEALMAPVCRNYKLQPVHVASADYNMVMQTVAL